MSDQLTKRDTDYAQWYNDLVLKADLAEHSDVRGCMVIKPHGYAIWEKMQGALDAMFKATGHVNAYFPLFIPKSYLAKEASHVEGFAKECAIVTHYRLKMDPEKGLIVDPDAKLEEELIVRPTSETIIWNTYRGWIKSYRDLPLLINQWANVVRWELRTRLFLRTAEFLWQEGHTAHATKAEAEEEARRMLDVYATFAEEWLAMPVIKGVKTPNERFAGALETYCIEALMQDGKALQAGTSHFLGQNFAKAFDVVFTNKENQQEHVWASSWGVSTRLMGALIMTHSDDHGLVLPPKLAPVQVAIVPIAKNGEQLAAIDAYVAPMVAALRAKGITVKYDNDDKRKPGWKFAEYEFKGYPVRIAVGPRDMENGTVEVARRDTLEKQVMQVAGIAEKVDHLLQAIQDNLYRKALTMREEGTHTADSYDEFKVMIEKGGFIMAHWDGTPETEERVKTETKATIRCIPLSGDPETRCLHGHWQAECATGHFCKGILMEGKGKPTRPKDPLELIIQLMQAKAGMKQDVFARTKDAFALLKEVLAELAERLESAIVEKDSRLHAEFEDQGELSAQLKVAGDTIIFHMHTNVFKLDQSHSLWKTGYLEEDELRGYFGVVNVYNFLSDSFKFDRERDLGYLVARLFLNKDGHFFLQGKRQLAFLYNDLPNDLLDRSRLVEVTRSVVLYVLDFDLLAPPYDQVNQVTVEEMKQLNANSLLSTGKRLGFRFQADSEDPT